MPKFCVTFKTPNAVDDPAGEEAVREATKRLTELGRGEDLGEEHEELTEYWKKSFKEFAAKWVRYGELVTIEFDTDAGTATVLPAGR